MHSANQVSGPVKTSLESRKSAWLLLFFLLATAVTAQQAVDPLEQHYQAAETFQIAANWDRAAAEYQQTIAMALDRAANLRTSEGKLSEAATLLQSAVQVEPGDTDARLDLAFVSLQQGDLKTCAAEVQGALAKNPQNVRAEQLLGKVDYLQGDYPHAAEMLKKSLARQPDLDSTYMLALAYLHMRNLPDAGLIFDEMLNSMGSTPQLHVLIGDAYRETEYFDQAIEEYRKAIALNPRYPRAHYYLGLTHLLQGSVGSFQKASNDFRAELAIQPRDFASHFFLGVIYVSQHKFSAAEAQLRAAAAIQPENPDPYFYLGQAYVETNLPQSAVAPLQRSISLTSEPSRNHYQVARAYYMLGRALTGLGKKEQASAAFVRAEQLRAQSFRSDQENLKFQEMGSGRENFADLESSSKRNSPSLVALSPPRAKLSKNAEAYIAQLAEILANAYNNLGVIEARRGNFADAATPRAELLHGRRLPQNCRHVSSVSAELAGQSKSALCPRGVVGAHGTDEGRSGDLHSSAEGKPSIAGCRAASWASLCAAR